MLRLAWSSASMQTRRRFLSELCCDLGRRPPPAHGDGTLEKFLAANVVERSHDRVQSSKLLKHLNEWRIANDLLPWTGVRLAGAMKALGFQSRRSHFAWWLGISLAQPPPSPGPPSNERKGRKPSQKR